MNNEAIQRPDDLLTEIARWQEISNEIDVVVHSNLSDDEKERRMQPLAAELDLLAAKFGSLKSTVLAREPFALPLLKEGSLDRCTDRAKTVLQTACALSIDRSHTSPEPQDLLDALRQCGGISEQILKARWLPRSAPSCDLSAVDDEILSETVQRLLPAATKEAIELGHGYIGTEHLLIALLRLHPEVIPDSDKVRSEVLELLGHD